MYQFAEEVYYNTSCFRNLTYKQIYTSNAYLATASHSNKK